MTANLSNEETRRYGRHLILPEVGLEGQQKLKAARVLIVGAGGLGSPAALYLAAAGVGTIGLVDSDVVDLSNLQRQIIHSTQSVGTSKLESARSRMLSLNPHVEVRTHAARLSSENALEILKDYDMIVDGTDNFPTRYLINDACVLLKKPDVYGTVFRFEGQVSVFDAGRGPCYRCLYPDPPPPDLAPTCADGGVLGVLPGVIGTLQATEVIKLTVGFGESLVGRLLLFDARRMEFHAVKVSRNPDCPICGNHPSIHNLIDYEAFCGAVSDSGSNGLAISVHELKERIDRGEDILLLDVREPHEREIVSIGGRGIPMKDLESRVSELNSAQAIVVYCHHGSRSTRAANLLLQRGFKNVRSLVGGIDQWAVEIDPALARY